MPASSAGKGGVLPALRHHRIDALAASGRFKSLEKLFRSDGGLWARKKLDGHRSRIGVLEGAEGYGEKDRIMRRAIKGPFSVAENPPLEFALQSGLAILLQHRSAARPGLSGRRLSEHRE